MNNWNNGFGPYNSSGYAPVGTSPQISTPPRIQTSQPMQPQIQQIPMGVPGRWVNDFNEIKPGEVPMDGTICFFPKSDYSCIYAKMWDQNGKLQDFIFVPQTLPQTDLTPQNDERLNKIMDDLESIKKQLSNINKPYRSKSNKKPYNPKYKKNEEVKS